VFFGTDPAKDGTWVNVAKVAWDPQYPNSDEEVGHDVAVAILEHPVDIKPLPFLTGALDSSIKGQLARVVGFGYNDAWAGRAGFGIKREGQEEIVSLNDQYIMSEPWENRVTCGGDSGGAFLLPINGVETLVGVTAYGDAECNEFGGYSRVDVNRAFFDQFLNADPSPTH
jgi:hypothetical protein